MEERERSAAKPRSAGPDRGDPSSPPGHRADQRRDPGQGASEELDVCSDSFDPLAALYSPAVPLPFPNIRCFNNVAEYQSFLRGGRGRAKPENVEKRQRKAAKGVADPERIERLKKLMVRNVPAAGEAGGAPRRRRQRAPKNVLTRMALCKGSPLGELHRCVEERIRVRVHIRTFKGLRGICSGFVVAFDKFWNLAMVDVDETYREPLLGDALYHEKALTVTRLFEKLKLQEDQESGGRSETPQSKGKSNIPRSDCSRSTPVGLSPQPAAGSQSGDGGTHRGLSRGLVKNTEGEPRAKAKARGPGTGPHPYGKVHTRHISQLFIRGENVLLVNLQRLQ